MGKNQSSNGETRNNRKKGSPKFNMEIVKRLVRKYGVTERFIKMSIDGERESETSSSIKKDYQSMANKVKAALK